MESSQSEVFYCGEDVVICNRKPVCISNLITLIPCYTLHRAPSNKSLSYTFSKLQVAIENGKGVAELFVSCRSVLSAFALGMASLRVYSVNVLYVRRSNIVVTPHKPLIKEKSTYPVRNPSCCCGKRLRQLLCVLPCTVKLHVSWMRVYFVQARVAFNTQRTLTFSRGPARVNSDKQHGPKSSDIAQMK